MAPNHPAGRFLLDELFVVTGRNNPWTVFYLIRVVL